LFGLLMPEAIEELYRPIHAEITRRAPAHGYAVLAGPPLTEFGDAVIPQAEAVCRQFIARRVTGVFFVPLEVSASQMAVNRTIAEQLQAAGIAVVLLNRDVCDYPGRSEFDMVGIDNRAAGFCITDLLLRRGCRRVDMVAGPWATVTAVASSATARTAGYRDALTAAGITPDPQWFHRWDIRDRDFVGKLVRQGPLDGIVCSGDEIARPLIHHLDSLGVRVPDDVRIASIDDLPFAKHLPVPLTTLAQPTRAIGAVAVETMLARLASPDMPTRHVMLDCQLRIRRSCGAPLEQGKERTTADENRQSEKSGRQDPVS
jgi:DNA-binding LacI/PurR family transcriptional regulator